MDFKNENRHPWADLFEAQGHKTYFAMGVLWIDAGRLSLISLPSTTPVAATREEVAELLRKSRRLMAIFPTSLTTGIPSGTFWVRDRDYGPQSLQRQFRQHVQRAAKLCSVRPLELDTLCSKARNCTIDSLQRRGPTLNPIVRESGWKRFCEVSARVSGLEAWVVFMERNCWPT
jgi:hypothetical protein